MTQTTSSKAEIRVVLNTEEEKFLDRPVVGNGGFQSLLRKLQEGRVFGSNCSIIFINADTAKRLMKVAKSGDPNGGYQRCLQPVIDQIVTLRKALYTRKRGT